MNNHNGCTGINCPFHSDCPYRDLPSCFTPANLQGDEEGTIEKAFQIGFQLGLMKACGHDDFVPVVRCKDCFYAREHDAANPGYTLVCPHNGTDRQVWGTDYCSYGVRKEQQKKDEKKEETT